MTGLDFPPVLFHLSLVLEVGIRQAGSTGGSKLYGTTIVVKIVISRFVVDSHAGGAGQGRTWSPPSLKRLQLAHVFGQR